MGLNQRIIRVSLKYIRYLRSANSREFSESPIEKVLSDIRGL
jgi:hypothetical protein